MARENLSIALGVLRLLSGRSQKELAAALGLTEGTLSDYERGKKSPSSHLLRQAATALGLSPTLTEPVRRLVQRVADSQENAAQDPAGLDDPTEAQRLEEVLAEGAEWLVDHLRTALPQRLAEERAKVERERAAGLWERLQRMTLRRQRILIEEEGEFRSWALVEVIGEASVKVAAHRADRAVQLAELGVFLAERLDGNEARRSSALGLAWAYLGNARRVHGKLPEADAAFARSRDFWAAGGEAGRGQLDESRLLDLEASLRIDQWAVEEALLLLQRARQVVVLPASRLRILTQLARALQFQGSHHMAIEVLREAQQVSGTTSEIRSSWLLEFSLAINLWHLGRFDEVTVMLPNLQRLVLRLGNDLDAVRLRWLRGRLAGSLSLMEEAIPLLESVTCEFFERDISSDVARAAIELAELYLREGRHSEVKRLLRRFGPALQHAGLRPETKRAAQLFYEAVETERASVSLARDLLVALQREPQLSTSSRDHELPI